MKSSYHYRAGIRRVTVRASSHNEAESKAREELDRRCEREGTEPPVSWTLELLGINGSQPRYPSVKTLTEAAPHKDRTIALRARKVLDGREPVAHYVGTGKSYAKLCAVDKVLGNHGVESVTFECQRNHENSDKPMGFDFSNTGDSYAATVVLYEGRFLVAGWADMLEWHERRCRKCLKRSREEMNQ